jgi:hypothetical protein
MAETILQHWLFTRFAFPFLLVFFLVFAILEKIKLFGEGKRQLNALVAFVLGLIFITFAYPVDVVSNLILFLTVALVVVFISLLIWGFLSGESKIEGKWVKPTLGVVLVIAIIIAVIWATGAGSSVVDWFFKQDWSGTLWTNIFFIVVIAIALALVLKSSGGDSK